MRLRRPRDRGPAEAPWVRTRLRVAPAPATALAALVLLTAFLLAALPRAVDAYENSALRRSIAAAPLAERSVSLTQAMTPSRELGDKQAFLTPGSLDVVRGDFTRLVGPPLHLLSAGASTADGVRSAQAPDTTDPGLPRLDPALPSRAAFFAQRGVAAHSRIADGTWPRARSATNGIVEAAVTDRTAKAMGLRAGSTVHVRAIQTVLTVRITAVVTPRGPDDPFWRAEPSLLTPAKKFLPGTKGQSDPYWEFGLLLNREDSALMLVLDGGAEMYWHRPVDVSRLTASELPATLAELASLDGGPSLVRLQNATGRIDLQTDEELNTALTAYEGERSATALVVLIAAVGTGTTAGIVLFLAVGLTAARRRTEFALLRSRGASGRGLATLLLGESAVVAVPAAALGTALALVMVPTQRYLPSLLLGGAVALVATLALPVHAVFTHRGPGSLAPQRQDAMTARPSRRRTVLELTVLVLVAGGVTALRRGGADGSDPYPAAVPVLLALAAALALIRLYPLPLRLLARPTSRLSGPVTHIGLARAGRSSLATQLPLLAVLVALTVASIGGSVLTEVAAGRAHAALTEVGADARVTRLTTLPDTLVARLRGRSMGVRETAAVRVEPQQDTDTSPVPYTLVVVDPASYDRLVRHNGGKGSFPAAALAGGRPGAPLPAVVSPALARRFGSAPFTVDAQAGPTAMRVAAVTGATPAEPDGDAVIVSFAAMRRANPTADRGALGPNQLYLVGSHLDGTRLTAAVHERSPDATVTLRSQVLAGFGTPLQTGARRIYLAAILAGWGYSALGLLLALLRTAPQRSALLARLRVLGMTRGQSRRLVLLEMVPQAGLAVLGGVAVSLASIGLLGGSVDLGVLAFGTDTGARPPGPGLVLRADPLSLAVPAVALLAVAYAVLSAQVWWSGRHRESAHLRAGDRI